jgi:putative ABC transport system substrate-binding protein
MPRRSRFQLAAVLALATALAAGAVEWPAIKRLVSQPVARLRVLVVGEPDWPAVARLGDSLADQGTARPRLPPVDIDLARASDDGQLRSAMVGLRTGLHRYAAIYVPSLSMARMVQQAVTDVPIVFEGVDDPEAVCLVDSQRRPGRNATGYMHFLNEAELRMLQVLKDAFPDLTEVVVPVSAQNLVVRNCHPPPALPAAGCQSGLHQADPAVEALIEAARLGGYARRLGLELHFFVTCGSQDFEALARLATARPHSGVMVPWQDLFVVHGDALARLLTPARRPTIGAWAEFAGAGGLFALEPTMPTGDVRESHRLLAEVLRGRSPAELPVSSPAGYSLVFNARAAAAQGLRPRLAVIARADQVLQ